MKAPRERVMSKTVFLVVWILIAGVILAIAQMEPQSLSDGDEPGFRLQECRDGDIVVFGHDKLGFAVLGCLLLEDFNGTISQ